MSKGYKHRDITYRSSKHPLLEHIFNEKTRNGTVGIGKNHTFTLADISAAYKEVGIREPASISNTILDLTRKDRGIAGRLPDSIVQHGYDLRKKTGKNLAGEFVYVGIGNALKSWHLWADIADKTLVLPNKVPKSIRRFLSNDEGALFSVMDYCDVLSHALYGTKQSVIRVQNPVKWQPNEIDGLYYSGRSGKDVLYPVEAKALTTGDEINLEQMLGAYTTITQKKPGITVMPLGIQMIKNGMDIGIFQYKSEILEVVEHIRVTFDPPLENWVRR